MELHLHSSALKSLIGRAKGGLRKKDHPVHGVAWMKATERSVVLWGGDLEFNVEAIADVADIKEAGEVGLPVDRLLGMADALFDGTVHVKTEEGSCIFYLARTRWKLPLVKSNTEVARANPLKDPIQLDQADFLTALEAAKVLLSDTSPYPLIRLRHGELQATNGKQACVIKLASWPKDVKAEVQFSNRGVNEAIQLLRQEQCQKVGVVGDQLWTMISAGLDFCWIRRIAVILPELDPLFELKEPKEVAVSAEQLLEALARVKALSSENAVATVTVTPNQITLRVTDQRGSEATDVVDCVWKGEGQFESSYEVSELETAIRLAAVKGELRLHMAKDKLYLTGARSKGVIAASTGAPTAGSKPVVRKPRGKAETLGSKDGGAESAASPASSVTA